MSAVSSRSNFLRLLCIFVLLISAAGCAKTHQGRSIKESGFFTDYSQFRKGKGDEAQLVYTNPAALTNFAHYNTIMIDSISVYALKKSRLAKLDKEQVESLVGYLHQALVTELGKDYQIVDKPGPDTLRLRVALTEARGSNVVLDATTTIIPQFRLLSSGAQLIADTAAVVGTARVEAELLDSVTGERLVAAVDERSGSKALKGVFNKWSDVQDAFTHWAVRARTRFAALRSGAAAGERPGK